MTKLGRVRVGLAILVLAALCVAAWTGAVGAIRRADRPSVDAHRAEMVAEARLSAQHIDRWFVDARASLDAPRTDLGAWSGSPPQIAQSRAILDRAMASPATAAAIDGGLIIVDARGRVLGTDSSLAALQAQVRSNAALDAVVGGADQAISDIVEDPLLHVAHVGLAVPLQDARKTVTGVLIGFTRAQHGRLAASIAAEQRVLGHRVALVTPGGTVLDGSDHPAGSSIVRVDDTVRDPAVAATRTHRAGYLRYRAEAGVDTIAAYAPVGPDSANLALVLPRSMTSLAVTGDRATRAAAAAIGVLLAAAFVVVVALGLLLRRRTRNIEETKQSFLAIAGHELRTPLTVIKGFTDLLSSRWDNVPDESRRGIVETIGYQVRNLEHLVERLLLGAQLEAGYSPSISHESVALAPLLEEAAAHQSAIAPSHEFTVDAPAELEVWADRKAVSNVLVNLVENAVKYSPNGGVVALHAEPVRDRVKIVVEDEGIGLPSDLDAIFEKFVQREAVDTRTLDEGGVGLGLYIVRTLVTQMGGSVRAEHRTPKGARLVVTLPRTARRRGRRRVVEDQHTVNLG
jgi:signal transduction histidine kinase